MPEQSPESLLLERWRDGDDDALDELTPLVYNELLRLARRAFREEQSGHTLQATALVNEAYLQLIRVSVDWKGKAHFYALAARMMRRILVNHANARTAKKRGGDALRVTFVESEIASDDAGRDVMDLDRGLAALAAEDARKAGLLELHYFAGMSYREAGEVLGVSEATAKRDLRFGKAWMRRYLASNPE
jgi:RNA polymerase sigma factor (TIGR02999 family)